MKEQEVIIWYSKYGEILFNNLRTMFEYLDAEGDYYAEEDMDENMASYYREAKDGNEKSLLYFMSLRSAYEYENRNKRSYRVLFESANFKA